MRHNLTSKGDIEHGDTLLNEQTVSWIDFEEPCHVSVYFVFIYILYIYKIVKFVNASDYLEWDI